MEALAKEHASVLYKLSMAEEKTRLAQSTEEEFRVLAARKDTQLRKVELELEDRGKQHGVLELELERARLQLDEYAAGSARLQDAVVRAQAERDERSLLSERELADERGRSAAAEFELSRLLGEQKRLREEQESGKREWEQFVRTRASIRAQRREAENDLKRALAAAVKAVESPR